MLGLEADRLCLVSMLMTCATSFSSFFPPYTIVLFSYVSLFLSSFSRMYHYNVVIGDRAQINVLDSVSYKSCILFMAILCRHIV
jgi:hypothetical protein